MTTHMSEQKYRPALHFAPKKNWMNDPNGMVYFEGEYHLFFQYNPNDSVWGPMHWGHAVSKDMISWEELDIALYPDENGTIFSGSAVVDWDNTTGFFPGVPGIVAIFTHHFEGGDGQEAKQSQSLAYSTDKGRTWTKYKNNPVLTHSDKKDFRDPKVFWHRETSKWVMVLATGQTISFYSSPNLIDWEFESEFGDARGSHDGVWECPDLFKLKVAGSEEEKWVLLVSIGDNPSFEEGSRTQYFIGSFDGAHFKEEHEDIRWLDFGKDNYAGVSFSDIPAEDGRRIYIGWMSNWRYANEVPTGTWRSQMTLPRELSLDKRGKEYYVIQNPVQELDAYFSQKEDLRDLIVRQEEAKRFTLQDGALDIELVIDSMKATRYGMTLHHCDDQETGITFDSSEGILCLNRENSGAVDFSDNFRGVQKVKLENASNLQLRIVVDASSVELFVNEGEYALTSLIYPDKACESVSIVTFDEDIKIVKGSILTLK